MVDLAGRRRLAVDPGLPTALTKTPFSSHALSISSARARYRRLRADSRRCYSLARAGTQGRRCARTRMISSSAGKKRSRASTTRETERERKRDRSVISAISISLKRDDLRYRREEIAVYFDLVISRSRDILYY